MNPSPIPAAARPVFHPSVRNEPRARFDKGMKRACRVDLDAGLFLVPPVSLDGIGGMPLDRCNAFADAEATCFDAATVGGSPSATSLGPDGVAPRVAKGQDRPKPGTDVPKTAPAGRSPA